MKCPSGKYCAPSAVVVSKLRDCDPGYYCKEGVDVRNPNGVNNNGTGGLCPPGHFCPLGTGVPKGCLEGTYSSSVRLEKSSDCTKCDFGMYCPRRGLNQSHGM